MARSRLLRRVRRLEGVDLALPGYGAACLLLGGASAAGAVANGLLQLAAVAICAWMALAPRDTTSEPLPRACWALLVGLAIVTFLQFAPLPPALWGALPGRAAIVGDYGLLGVTPPWLPVSLAPDRAIGSALSLLPFLATLLLATRSSAEGRVAFAWVMVAVAGVSIGIGAVQLFSGGASWLYFYRITNHNDAVGFFANSNHLATLFVMTLPFIAALAARDERSERRSRVSRRPLHIGAFLFVTFGAILNGSSAGLALLVPSVGASILIYLRGIGRPVSARVVVVGTALIAGGLLFVSVGPFHGRFLDKAISSGNSATRGTSISLTIKAARAFMPLGSGVGSFRRVYSGYENPATLNGEYVNHAHCDWAEIALETGVLGLALLLAFCLWLVLRGRTLWTGDAQSGSLARAALTALVLLLLHSLVDYPARTAAILCVAGMAAGLVAVPKPVTRSRDRQADEAAAPEEDLKVLVAD